MQPTTYESMTEALTESIQKQFKDSVLATHRYRGQETVLVKRDAVIDVLRWLKDSESLQFDFLMDLTCVDYKRFGMAPKSSPTMATPSPLPFFMEAKEGAEVWERGVDMEDFRFDVVYHLYSSANKNRLRIKVPLTEEDPEIDSATVLWKTANWFEREVWDLFGIRFTGHPDLRRLLMYESFEGHPLRKDFPLRGRQPLIGPKETV